MSGMAVDTDDSPSPILVVETRSIRPAPWRYSKQGDRWLPEVRKWTVEISEIELSHLSSAEREQYALRLLSEEKGTVSVKAPTHTVVANRDGEVVHYYHFVEGERPSDRMDLHAKLEKVIQVRGQVCPVHVRRAEDGSLEVVDGHRILDALLGLGVERAWVYDHGPMSRADAMLLTVELNESRGLIDPVLLALVLREVTKAYSPEEVASRTYLTAEEVETFKKLPDFDLEAFARGAPRHVTAGKTLRTKLRNRLGGRTPDALKVLKLMRGLTGMQMHIALAYRLADSGNGASFTLEELSKITGYSDLNEICKARKRLWEVGWLVRDAEGQARRRFRRRKNVFAKDRYFFKVPPGLMEASVSNVPSPENSETE